MSLVDLLNEAVETELNRPAVKSGNSYYCVIQFGSASRAEVFGTSTARLFPGFKQYDEFLYRQCADYNSAIALVHSVESLLDNYKDLLLLKPFVPNWLHAHLEDKRFGALSITTSSAGLQEQNIAKDIKERRDFRSKMTTYCRAERIAIDQAALVTLPEVGKSFSDYLIKNWEGFDSDEHIISVVSKIMQQVSEFTSEIYQLPSHPCQQIVFAIDEKIEAIEGASRAMNESIAGCVDRYVKASDMCAQWKDLRRKIRAVIEDNTHEIAPRGFMAFLDSDDDVIDAPLISRFEGVSFEYDMVYDMNHRLSLTNLKYDVVSQGHRLNGMLAGAIAAYCLKVLELRQLAVLESVLREFSRNLDGDCSVEKFTVAFEAALKGKCF